MLVFNSEKFVSDGPNPFIDETIKKKISNIYVIEIDYGQLMI